jgi:6-phosphogluconolactonase/glucosamine-6-phosphate isomerase/deaminase
MAPPVRLLWTWSFLGMGSDSGHTYSLFPNHELLGSSGAVLYLTDSPKPHLSALRLAYNYWIMQSHVCLLWLEREKSWGVGRSWVIRMSQNMYPAGMGNNILYLNLCYSKMSETIWILDEDAASLNQ